MHKLYHKYYADKIQKNVQQYRMVLPKFNAM